MLDKPPKKPGGEEVDNINTAAPRTCNTSSEHEKRKKTTTNMLENMEAPNIVRMKKKTNQETIKRLPWDNFIGKALVSHINMIYQHNNNYNILPLVPYEMQ